MSVRIQRGWRYNTPTACSLLSACSASYLGGSTAHNEELNECGAAPRRSRGEGERKSESEARAMTETTKTKITNGGDDD